MTDEQYERVFKPFPFQHASDVLRSTKDDRIKQIIHDYKALYDLFGIIYRDCCEQRALIARLEAENEILKNVVNTEEV